VSNARAPRLERTYPSRQDRRSSPSTDARLAFVEALLACGTVTRAAELGVAWLAERVHLRQAAVLVGSRSRGGASFEVAASRGLGARDLAALSSGALPERCVRFPLGRPGGARSAPAGYLVAGGFVAHRGLASEIDWLNGVLARRLADLASEHDALEQVERAKAQFLQNMSHELRTPLNAILGYTSMMLQGLSGPVAPPMAHQLGRVQTNGRHLLAIIDDVLELARVEAGDLPLDVTRFSVGALVSEVLSELAPRIERSGLEVRVHVPRRLPSLRSDRAKVKQVVSNLLSNALKFTAVGTVTVSARMNRRKSRLRISVADTGIGISQADRVAIFQDFRQLDGSPTRRYGGAGLGLAVCRKLAADLHGEIALVSEPGQGSTFTLSVPVPRRSRRSEVPTPR